jgi:hypothetical protein
MPLRFVWVNQKLKPMEAFCAFDHVQIMDGYVRNLATEALYHDAYCLARDALACHEIANDAKTG